MISVKKLALSTVALLLVLAILSGCSAISHSPVGEYIVPYTDTSFHVSPRSYRTLTVHAGAGDRIEGYFTIRGGADEVKFRIEDSYGSTIYNAGLVYDRHDFRVICGSQGYYTLYFDNSFSWTVGKDVYLHYRVR